MCVITKSNRLQRVKYYPSIISFSETVHMYFKAKEIKFKSHTTNGYCHSKSCMSSHQPCEYLFETINPLLATVDSICGCCSQTEADCLCYMAAPVNFNIFKLMRFSVIYFLNLCKYCNTKSYDGLFWINNSSLVHTTQREHKTEKLSRCYMADPVIYWWSINFITAINQTIYLYKSMRVEEQS